MHEEFAPDFLSEDFLLSGVPEEEEEADIEEEEESVDEGDTDDEEAL